MRDQLIDVNTASWWTVNTTKEPFLQRDLRGREGRKSEGLRGREGREEMKGRRGRREIRRG